MAPLGSEQYMELVGATALLCAGFLLLARIFKLGFLADFLSRTVLAGFLAGVGVQVGVAMLGEMLGIPVIARRTVAQFWQVLHAAPELHVPTLGISVAMVTTILLCRHFVPRLPVPLFAVVAGIVAGFAGDLAAHGVALIGKVPGGLPSLGFPHVSWKELLALLPVAVSCVVMIIAQSAAAARVFAVRHHEQVDEDADILGLSAANAAAAVTGTFVVNGSPTQTAMAELAGARSQVAQVAFAGVVALVLLFFTGPLKYLPRCLLASIVFTIAVSLVDVKSLRQIHRESPGEFKLAALTAATVALVGVEQGILLALALSLLRHVSHSYHPHTAVLVRDEADNWIPVPAVPGVETEPGLLLYRFGADLFYANDTRFAGEVRALIEHAPTPVRFFVVEASAITNLDYSAARSMHELCKDVSQRGVELFFARVPPSLRADMDRHGITADLGEARLFTTLHGALAAVPGGLGGGRASAHA
jgi:MFS superfamily sulfate permease-like transporter